MRNIGLRAATQECGLNSNTSHLQHPQTFYLFPKMETELSVCHFDLDDDIIASLDHFQEVKGELWYFSTWASFPVCVCVCM